MVMCGRAGARTAQSASGPEPPIVQEGGAGSSLLALVWGCGASAQPLLVARPSLGPGTLCSPSLTRPSGPCGVRSPRGAFLSCLNPSRPGPRPVQAAPLPAAFPLPLPGQRDLLPSQRPSQLEGRTARGGRHAATLTGRMNE